MATRGIAMTIAYVAWDTSANAGKTGDVANHTLRWIKDGTSTVPTNSPAEVDSVNAPGIYKIALTASEADCDIGILCGKSATSDVSIVPVVIQFERLPNAAPGANGGVAIVGSAPLTNLDVAVSTRANGADYTASRAAKLDNLDAAITTRASAATALSNVTWTDARAAKLDNIDDTITSRAPATSALNNSTWTDARAAKLDNLDAAITTRASAATALSNVTWTDIRAAKLDNIDAAITSRATAADVWNYSSRSLTAFAFGVDLNMNQVLPTSPISNTTGQSLKWIDTNIASRPTAADVWSHSTRTLTAFAFSVDVNMNQTLPTSPISNTIGQSLKWIDTNIASRPTVADVWSHATRTLTAFGFSVDVNMNQMLPVSPISNTVGQSLKWIDTNIASRPTAADVWSHATRTLTAFGFSVDVNMNQILPVTPTTGTVGKSLKNAADYVDAATSAIKSQTDKLTFDGSNNVYAVCTGGGGGGSVQVIVQPLSVRVFEPAGDGGMIMMWRYARARAAWYINSDLRLSELVWLVYSQSDPDTAVAQCTSADGEITVEWQDTYSRSYVSVDAAESKVPPAGSYRYVLRDQTADTVLVSGTLIVRAAPDAS